MVSDSQEAPEPAAHDTELVRRCRLGETAAFDELVRRHQRLVFAVAVRLLGSRDEAQDVSQDAFVRAYRGIGGFRGESKFSTWVLSILMNLCRNRRCWWARQRQHPTVSLDEPRDADSGESREVPDHAPSPAVNAARAELAGQIAAALELLDDAGRAVIVLRDIEDLSYEEIAEVLGCEVGTVKSRLSRARLRLRALLDGRL